MSGPCTPRPIRDGDDVAAFSSGEPSLDGYLRSRAPIARSMRAADLIGVRALLVHAVSLHLLILIKDARAAISSSAPPD